MLKDLRFLFFCPFFLVFISTILLPSTCPLAFFFYSSLTLGCFSLLLPSLPPSLCSLQEIQSLLTNWKGPDLIGYGELVLEGTFRLQRAKNERTLFLFDKLLLLTKKREETYSYKAHILVSHATPGRMGLTCST